MSKLFATKMIFVFGFTLYKIVRFNEINYSFVNFRNELPFHRNSLLYFFSTEAHTIQINKSDIKFFHFYLLATREKTRITGFCFFATTTLKCCYIKKLMLLYA